MLKLPLLLDICKLKHYHINALNIIKEAKRFYNKITKLRIFKGGTSNEEQSTKKYEG